MMILGGNLVISKEEAERYAIKLPPEISTTRILDEFGFPVPTEPKAAISKEDLELTKRFLGNLKDQTLSRSIHRVLSDLLGRLP